MIVCGLKSPTFPLPHQQNALIARCKANNNNITFAFGHFKYFSVVVVVVIFPAELLKTKNVQKFAVFLISENYIYSYKIS